MTEPNTSKRVVIRRERPQGEPGRAVLRVSSAEAGAARMVAGWEGKERPADKIKLSLPTIGNRTQ